MRYFFGLLLVEYANAAEFHVTTALELETALETARDNGVDDAIYLAAGTYVDNFYFSPLDGKSLLLQGELGTTAQDVILDGGATGARLT